jgi:hypothetical protein
MFGSIACPVAFRTGRRTVDDQLNSGDAADPVTLITGTETDVAVFVGVGVNN